jgi:hypothetical protein
VQLFWPNAPRSLVATFGCRSVRETLRRFGLQASRLGRLGGVEFCENVGNGFVEGLRGSPRRSGGDGFTADSAGHPLGRRFVVIGEELVDNRRVARERAIIDIAAVTAADSSSPRRSKSRHASASAAVSAGRSLCASTFPSASRKGAIAPRVSPSRIRWLQTCINALL